MGKEYAKCNFMIIYIRKSTFLGVFWPAVKNLVGSEGCVTHKKVSVGAPHVFIVTGIIYTIIIALRLRGGEWGRGWGEAWGALSISAEE